jgi:hypothetical protein
VLIPSVVGLRGDGLEWTVELTSTVALHVIADVPEHSQRALAAGLIRCEEVGTSLGPSKLTAADALREAEERVPGAVAWAREFTEGSTITPKRFAARSAPSVMRCAVHGVVSSTTPDPDARLRDLLQVGITTAERLPAHDDAVRSLSESRGRSGPLARTGR